MAEVYDISTAFELQREDMQLTEDIMGGTKAMVRAGESYLPKAEGESSVEWRRRVSRTVLFNAYKKTVRFCRGQVFQKPVAIPEPDKGSPVTSEQLVWYRSFSEDVDKQGHNITVWGGSTFEDGINAGVTFCLVDYSRVETRDTEGGREYLDNDGEWKPLTRAVEDEKDWSPYFVHVRAKQVIDCQTEWHGGKAVVSHFRYVEDVDVTSEEWAQTRIQRIRCFWPGRYQTYENSQDGGTDFELVSEGELRDTQGNILSIVPVAWFMPGEPRTLVTAEPAMQDLAELNKRHWQATSDQYEMMEFVRRPVWLGRGMGNDPDNEIQFGAGRLICTSLPEADLFSRGVDAGSVEAGRQELQDLESQMALFGLQLLQPKTGTITATEAARDTQESNSTLQGWALSFQDFLENCLKLVALWRGEEDGPSVVVNTDFAKPIDKSFLLEVYRAGALSKAALLEQVKKAGDLSDDLDIQAELDQQAQELSTSRAGSSSGGLSRLLSTATGTA